MRNKLNKIKNQHLGEVLISTAEDIVQAADAEALGQSGLFEAVIQYGQVASFDLLYESVINQFFDPARERYAELIDKKFGHNLSPNEQQELLLLEKILDEIESPVYKEIIEQLKQVRDELAADRAK